MKYYIDTEFLEGTQDKRFLGFNTGRKTKPTIDLISIGIVAEDGREYYAVSKDFNLKEAWNRYDWKERTKEQIKHTPALGSIYKEYWIRYNVLKPIYDDLAHKEFPDFPIGFTYSNMKKLIHKHGKTNKQIAEEVKDFCRDQRVGIDPSAPNMVWPGGQIKITGNPEFYAYYADYDWVALCWLFGNMIDLPKSFPMYCRDLKQIMDELCEKSVPEGHHENFEYALKIMKDHPYYPKQQNEHNALADARWNYQLHEFLEHLQR